MRRIVVLLAVILMTATSVTAVPAAPAAVQPTVKTWQIGYISWQADQERFMVRLTAGMESARVILTVRQMAAVIGYYRGLEPFGAELIRPPIDSPSQLEMRSLNEEVEGAGEEWNNFTYQRQARRVVAPLIYKETATALAKFECPAYEDFDKEAVFYAFMQVFYADEGRGQQKWFAWLKQRVSDLSRGKVTLAEASRDEFDVLVKGLAIYCALESAGRRQLVIIVPAHQPVMFDKGRGKPVM